MQKEVRASVVEEQTSSALAIAATGRLDQVGEGEGAGCILEGYLEVECPLDQDLEPGGLRCPPEPGVVCQWRWAVGVERKRLVQEEVRASVVEEQTIRVVAIAAKGRLDEEGGSEGWECHLEGHLEVKSP